LPFSVKSSIWQQIIGNPGEKLARLSGSRHLNETLLRALERKGQDYHLKLLKHRGQLVKDPDGGTTILSYPESPVR
jgi:hypothetical protein